MILIQLLIILSAVVLVFYVLSRRATHSGKAWKKVGLVLLAVAMIVVVIFPETTNTLAHFVGVGRGADLLLYGIVVAFIFYALNNYLHQQDQRSQIYQLARRLAILEATTKKEKPQPKKRS
jgi:hypothetical protein